MKGYQDFSSEEQKKIALAVENGDIESFKDIIGFNSLPVDEKAIWMLRYEGLYNAAHDAPFNGGRIYSKAGDQEKDELTNIRSIVLRTFKSVR